MQVHGPSLDASEISRISRNKMKLLSRHIKNALSSLSSSFVQMSVSLPIFRFLVMKCALVHACAGMAQNHRQNFSVMLQMSRHLEIKWIQNSQKVSVKMNKIIKWYSIYSGKFKANVCLTHFISNWNNERFQVLSCCYNECNNKLYFYTFHQNAHTISQEMLYAFLPSSYLVVTCEKWNFNFFLLENRITYCIVYYITCSAVLCQFGRLCCSRC